MADSALLCKPAAPATQGVGAFRQGKDTGGDFRGHKVIGGDADRRLSDTRTAELTAVGGTVRVGVVSPLSRRLGLSVVEAFLPSRGQVSTTVGGRCSFR